MFLIRKDHLPMKNKKRTKIPMTPTFITVHSTGNPKSNAMNERAWLTNPSNTTETGFHYVVDDQEAIECIPPTEVAWHAGDGRESGNLQSMGIEICESGDRKKTLQNAIELIQYLMKTYNITNVVRHYDWSKKNCPRILNTKGDWSEWKNFLSQIQQQKSEYDLSIDILIKFGIISSPDYWRSQEDKNVQALIKKTAQVLDNKETSS